MSDPKEPTERPPAPPERPSSDDDDRPIAKMEALEELIGRSIVPGGAPRDS